MKNPRVMVCHHDNLRDSKYRKRDKLHLTEHGTSRLANNLKFKIAESLGIKLTKKRKDEYRYEDRNERQWNRNDSRIYKENNYSGRYRRQQCNEYNEYNET